MAYVLTNARVRTCAPDGRVADTVAIADGHVVFVGARADRPVGPGFTERDLGGRTVVPGFVDGHAHPSMVARSRWHVRLPWTEDVATILAFIRDYASAHPDLPMLYFEYYPSTAFGGDAPTKDLLDAVVPDRPVFCQEFSEHQHWVNSRMLELMGVTAETPDPVPGLEVFVRDEAGEPTGLLREMVHEHFMDRVYDALDWRPPEDLTPERLAPFFRFMTEHGVTALFEALVDEDRAVASIAELDRRGELGLRYEGALRFRNSADLPGVVDRLHRLDREHGGPHVRLRTVKLFLDGTNETGNSAVLEPFVDATEQNIRGELGMETPELTDCLLLLNRTDVDAHVHLVGDRAFRTACDAVEAARASVGDAWRIQVTLAHCELIDPADLLRPAALGITVNWTPHWSGGYFGEEARRHLGDERWDRMYRFAEIADSGARLTFGSDVVTEYELHRGAPLFGMQVAATRVDPEYPLDGTRYPDGERPPSAARLGPATLLDGYTIAAARQLRLDHLTGSIEVGKSADLIVLDADPLDVGVDALRDIGIDAVFFEGDLVDGSV